MRSRESIFQYVTYFYFHCVLILIALFLVKFPSALDFAAHSAKELSFVVPAALLLLLLAVAQAGAVPSTHTTGAPPTLHPSRPCQREKQCPSVTAGCAPKTESKGPDARMSSPLAILKNPHTYSEAIPKLHAFRISLLTCTCVLFCPIIRDMIHDMIREADLFLLMQITHSYLITRYRLKSIYRGAGAVGK